MDSTQNRLEVVHPDKPLSSQQPASDRPGGPAGGDRPSSPSSAVSRPVPVDVDAPRGDRPEPLRASIPGPRRDLHPGQTHEDFSVMRTLAGVVQTAALACLVIALWNLTGQNTPYDPVFAALGFAGVLQVMALTFYTLDRK